MQMEDHMPKEEKLSLDQLSVKSFVTALHGNKDQLRGGDNTLYACKTQAAWCQSEAPSGGCCPSDIQPCP